MKSKRLPKSPPTAKASFIKMAIAGVALIMLVLICVREIDPGLRATLLTFVAIVVFPSTLLFGVDAGKAIKRSEVPGGPSNKFAAVLIFPQAIFGGILIGAGLVVPFVSVGTLAIEASSGRFAEMSAIQLVVSLMLPVVGIKLINEGLGRTIEGSPSNAFRIPRWLRVVVFANTMAICTSLLVFIVFASATNGVRAAWIWKPVVSIALFLAATPLAARHLTWRRRHTAK
jgi:hypothetical protein